MRNSSRNLHVTTTKQRNRFRCLVNPFTADSVKALHFAILVLPTIFLIFDIRAFWRSGLSARAPECQKLKMVGYASMALDASNSSSLEQLALKGLSCFVFFTVIIFVATFMVNKDEY